VDNLQLNESKALTQTLIRAAPQSPSRKTEIPSSDIPYANLDDRHRLSTVVDSDQIVVLHKGEILERGTHTELLALRGRYHAMWQKQTTIEKKQRENKEEVEGSSSETGSQE
jgi:hypothetical protein